MVLSRSVVCCVECSMRATHSPFLEIMEQQLARHFDIEMTNGTTRRLFPRKIESTLRLQEHELTETLYRRDYERRSMMWWKVQGPMNHLSTGGMKFPLYRFRTPVDNLYELQNYRDWNLESPTQVPQLTSCCDSQSIASVSDDNTYC